VQVETVLVTGAGGFIGSHLVDDQLARGRRVMALDLNLNGLNHVATHPRCKLVSGDIRNSALLREVISGIDVVFHLASAHLEVNKPASYFEEINVAAVRQLLEVSHTHNVKRFVHCSSVGVYGPLAELPANEETACRPDIPYEETKLAGESVVRDFAKMNDLSFVILRPAWVYGPRCPRTLKLFRSIKKRRFFLVGNGENLRHPLYVSDMLEAFELAATKGDVNGETFVIASEEPVELRYLIEGIARLEHVSLPQFKAPLSSMKVACAAIEGVFKLGGKEPPISRRSLKFFTESSAFDIAKAKRFLAYNPKVRLDEGLSETHRFYVDNALL
jgi:nucleoside-diphosphate-sugar epimerase